jgi:hypothetical protein
MDSNRYSLLARNLRVTVKLALAFWLVFAARWLLG